MLGMSRVKSTSGYGPCSLFGVSQGVPSTQRPNPLGDPVPLEIRRRNSTHLQRQAPKIDQGMQALRYGLVWSFTSQQFGLGNVSDPALLQLPDGTLRLFFKNGNEPQMGLTGFDNKIHSFVSEDGGASWSLEEGIRIDVNSPVSCRGGS